MWKEVLRNESRHGIRVVFVSEKLTKSDEKVIVQFVKCMNDHTQASLPKLWFRNGSMPYELETWWDVTCELHGKIGRHPGYNPTINLTVKKDIERKRTYRTESINFEWLLEATDENMNKILDEIASYYFKED